MFKKKLMAGFTALALCFSLGACGGTGSTQGATQGATSASGDTASQDNAAQDNIGSEDYAKVREKGKLVVGITDFEPMDYKDEAGNWIGFDAEMATAFAHSLDVEVEFVEIDWDNKALELSSGAIDCVWNGMTFTDEVKSAMDCSKAYCNNAQIIVVNKAKA